MSADLLKRFNVFKQFPKLSFSTLVIAFIALLAFFIHHKPNQSTENAAVLVNVAPARLEYSANVETIPGSIVALQSASLVALSSGTITGLHFKNGAEVKKGSLLVQLDSSAALAHYQNAAAKFEAQRVNYQQYISLQKADPEGVSHATIIEADATFKEAKADLAAAQTQLNDTKIVAPFDGTLASTTLSVGSYVQQGEAVVSLVNRDALEVVYQLPQADYSLVQAGQTVALSVDAYPDTQFTGTVNYIAPLINNTSDSFTVRARINDPQHRLSPGMNVIVTHTFNSQNKALLIPSISLIPDVSGYTVFVVQNGSANQRTIQIGQQSGEYSEVLSGLQAGDKIIVAGQEKVSDGMAVQVGS